MQQTLHHSYQVHANVATLHLAQDWEGTASSLVLAAGSVLHGIPGRAWPAEEGPMRILGVETGWTCLQH